MSGTFKRGHHAQRTHERNARLIRTLDRTPPTPAIRDRFEFPDPVDLRGIPAIGRGVTGTVPGTQPDRIAA